MGLSGKIINLTILECKFISASWRNKVIFYNKSNHIGM